MNQYLNRDIKNKKSLLLSYFRSRATEAIAEANRIYGTNDYKDKAKKINSLLSRARITLVETVKQKAYNERWTNADLLEGILMITYCNYVAMLEARHSVWQYEYMTFSRRIGELWEPFCKLPFEYPLTQVELFVPPLFDDVRNMLSTEIADYIDNLNITIDERNQLKRYYSKVWGLVTSGEIQLELDLHFIYDGRKYVVDFKSGFGSNEKGNTNRLLLVASIYHNIEDNYQPLIFVRSGDNNNYFNTLKNSGIWQAFCGSETYVEIHRYTGHDIREWIENNIKWHEDLNADFMQYLQQHGLSQYLTW